MKKETEKTERIVFEPNWEKTPYQIIDKFWEDFSSKNVLAQAFDALPYMVCIFSPDGFLVYGNRTLCEKMNITNLLEIIGRYNIFKDPFIIRENEFAELLKRTFGGLTSSISNIRIPLGRLSPIKSKPQNLMSFPIFDDKLQLIYVMLVSHDNLRLEKEEIIKAQNYMHEHWQQDYCIDKIADFVGVSSRHLQRLFKENMNQTPLDYYKSIKIRKIKNTLYNANISISEAFALCGVEYNGTNAAYFKKMVGLSPQEYQKSRTSG